MSWGVVDQAIQELEDQLFSKILFAQSQFNQIKPAAQHLSEAARTETHELQQLRGCDFKLPSLLSGRGHGPFVELNDGSVKYDLIGGIGPYLLGHSHPLQIRSQLRAARGSILNSTNFLPANIALQTSKALIDIARPSRLEHVWFCGSGAMANDAALRLVTHKKAQQKRLIAFDQSFAGRSYGVQALTSGKSGFNDFAVDYLPFPHNEETTDAALKKLSEYVQAYPDQHAAFYGEIVQGEAGVHLPNPLGIKKLFQKIKSHSISIWIDEVQTFARTPHAFAYQAFELNDYVDLITIGKAFNLSAVLYTNEFSHGDGLGGTFQAPVASLLYAQDLMRLLKDGNFFGPRGRIKALEMKIKTSFEHQNIKAHGVGTMWAIHCPSNTLEANNQYLKQLYNNGIIAWRAGRNPYYIRLLFPLTLNESHIEEISKIIATSLSDGPN